MQKQPTNAARLQEQQQPVIKIKAKTVIIPLGEYLKQPQSAASGDGGDYYIHDIDKSIKHAAERTILSDLFTDDLQEALAICLGRLHADVQHHRIPGYKKLKAAMDLLMNFGITLGECDQEVFRKLYLDLGSRKQKLKTAI